MQRDQTGLFVHDYARDVVPQTLARVGDQLPQAFLTVGHERRMLHVVLGEIAVQGAQVVLGEQLAVSGEHEFSNVGHDALLPSFVPAVSPTSSSRA